MALLQDLFSRFRSPSVEFRSLGLERDVHGHLLPGVDDGVQTVEEAVSILKLMSEAGMSRVTITPHLNPDVYPSSDEAFITGRYREFVGQLPAGVPELTLAAEYMVTDEFHLRDPHTLLQLEPGKVLIEMSYFYPSQNIKSAIFALTSEGMTPILAHPERYVYMADHLELFDDLHEMGCEYQMNVLSLSGCYGAASMRILKYLLKNGLYSRLGTDTHTHSHIGRILGLKVPDALLPGVERLISLQNAV